MVKVCRDASSHQNGGIISIQFPTSTFTKATIMGGVEDFSSFAEIFWRFFSGGDADRWHWPADCRHRLFYPVHLGRRSASVSVLP